MSEASHDLIQLLDEPVSDGRLYILSKYLFGEVKGCVLWLDEQFIQGERRL